MHVFKISCCWKDNFLCYLVHAKIPSVGNIQVHSFSHLYEIKTTCEVFLIIFQTKTLKTACAYSSINGHGSIFGTWLLHGQRSFPLHCIVSVLICTLVNVNASMPFKNVFHKHILFFPTGCLKISNFSHLSDLVLLSNADSAKNNTVVNATFIQCRNNAECNHVFCKFFCDLQRNDLKWKVLFHFWNNRPNRYQNQHLYENPLQCKCFIKIIVRKFIKVCIFNENKHKGLNKRKNSFCIWQDKEIFTLPNITIVEFCKRFCRIHHIILAFVLKHSDVIHVLCW